MSVNEKTNNVTLTSTDHSHIIRENSSGTETHVKSHDMVFASLALTPKMCDVLSLLFTKMRAEDWFVGYNVEKGKPAQPRYEFTAKEMGEFFCIDDTRHLSSILKVPARRLNETVVGFEKSNGDFDFAPLFSRIKYEKKILTIVPNAELRDSYIAKAKSNGYALINNMQYLALSDTHSKKTLDLLSRFKSGSSLYPISIKKLQYLYGVYGVDGKLLKPTYKSPATFMRRVIAPSLVAISESEASKGRIKILTSDSGTLGYEIIDGQNGEKNVRFLYKWFDCFTEEEIEQANKDVESLLLKNLQLQKEGRSMELEDLYELKTACDIVATDSSESEELVAPILEKVIESIKSKEMEMEEISLRAKQKKEDSSKNRIQTLLQKGMVNF
ncbi:replication initiation protein [Vibrio marisflavi]|uniref:Initiator Rep protein WH1 domain-containing protein n=1 Tax=Vibrio marisflavi CECT 7928 TaxID=634439 RepID=A0ABM9AA12_9VIBR|nr:replication initiation protein [Vibrio marisflavi]CAH0543173.1 hypothetical protein VMF7928_04438 [Vibrio marisflavi CECT 7928]